MNERTCERPGCAAKHLARGLCRLHWKREHGTPTRYAITCAVCGHKATSSRRDGKFCSDGCKGRAYSTSKATRCRLEPTHPVMVLIAESRRRKVKPAPFHWRTARECPSCACTFTPLRTPTAVCCSRGCTKRMMRRRRRARENNTLNTWRWSDFMRIAQRFDYCCAYCGEHPVGSLEPDHVMPLSRGGDDAIANLLPSCHQCNSDKNARTLDEWAVWRAARGKSPRRTSWLPGDTRYTHLTSEVGRAA